MATIQGIYIALFGRPADPVGLRYFTTATSNGTNLNAIGDLASTPEYQSRFEGMDTTEIVTAIYQSLFARNPEEEGLVFFVNALAAGTYTINNVAIAILDGAQGPDLEIVRNKIAAATVFTGAIDTPDELAAYRGDKAADAGRAFITPVSGDDDSIPSKTEADAVLTLLVNGPPASSQFVLTEGADTADTAGAFTNGGPGNPGTAANFKFTDADQIVVATSATLGRTDSLIDAVTTDNDRLQLTLLEDAIFPLTKNIENIEIDANTATDSMINLALVTGAKTLDLSGLLIGHLTIADIGNTGLTLVDGSGLSSAILSNGFTVDFSSAVDTLAREIVGSAASDTLTGGNGDDKISGGAGNDGIFGGKGNDTISGGEGNNTIDGGDGNDVIIGGSTSDTLRGGVGNDTIDGGGDSDGLFGGAGSDVLRGGDGMDGIAADEGSDTVIGGAGNDTIALFKNAETPPFVPDGEVDTIVFEATATGNGADQIFGFEAGAVNDKIDISAFLGAPVSFFEFFDANVGKGTMGLDGSGNNVFVLFHNAIIDTVAELTDAIGKDAGDLFIGVNTRAVIAMQNDNADTELYYAVSDATGAAAVTLVGTLFGVAAADLSDLNFR